MRVVQIQRPFKYFPPDLCCESLSRSKRAHDSAQPPQAPAEPNSHSPSPVVMQSPYRLVTVLCRLRMTHIWILGKGFNRILLELLKGVLCSSRLWPTILGVSQKPSKPGALTRTRMNNARNIRNAELRPVSAQRPACQDHLATKKEENGRTEPAQDTSNHFYQKQIACQYSLHFGCCMVMATCIE